MVTQNHQGSESGQATSKQRTVFESRTKRHPELRARIRRLAFKLEPLVQITTGRINPHFPPTMLHYHLLTEAQLEDLAHFYHQHTPCKETIEYPELMRWRAGMTIDEKRRKWGRFMGLRGCETPFVLKTEEEILAEARAARATEEGEIWKMKNGGY